MYFKSKGWPFYLTQLSWHLQTADKDTGNGRFKYNWLASWVVQGLSYLSAQGALTRPFGQLPGVGDDRLIQTHSHAANPNGLILTSVPVSCVTIKQPLSVTSVKAFQPFPANMSREDAGHWRSQSNPTVTLLSLSHLLQWSWTATSLKTRLCYWV